MKYNNIEEWQAKGKELFGDNILNWAFICPACGKISTGFDFKNAGATQNDTYNSCIGRHNGKGISGVSFKGGNPPENGCDWAAFGLFKTLGKGDVVISEDGSTIHIFKFAVSSEATDE